MARQIVGDLEPRRLAADEDMTFRPRRRVVEQRQGDAVLRGGIGKRSGRLPVRPSAIEDRRTAVATEAALIAARAFVIFDQVLALEPAEIPGRDPRAAAKRRAMLLAALRAMTVQRIEQRPGDFKCDAAAQAAATDWGHEGLCCWWTYCRWGYVAGCGL
jgi:hypothetical protein